MQPNGYVPALRFNWLTPYYDAVVGATTRERVFKQALAEQARIQPGQRVLDLGCGTGTLAVLTKQKQPLSDVLGIDGDPAILAIASHKAAKAGVNVTFSLALSHDLPYESRRFDRAISSLFFHHLNWNDKQRTTQELFRVLKPGGELHVADWGRPTNALMRSLFLSIQVLDGFTNTRDNVSGRLVELFSESGFANVCTRRCFNTIYGTLALYSAVKPL